MQWSHPLPSLQPVPAQDVSSEELALPLFFNEDQPSDGSGFGWPFNGLRYGIFQFEQCPSTKRVHAQGYCQFTKELRLSALKKISKRPTGPSPLVRLPKIVPTVPSSIPESKEQSRLNLASSSLLPSEASPPPLKKQFSEYDLTQTLQSRISSSCSPKSGSDTDLIARVRLANNLVGKRDIRVLFIYGKPGIGKSTFVFERYPGAYWKPPGKWWDGYSGQETVVFDDFDGSWFSCSELLRILNPFPTSVEVKGAVFNLSATNFVIVQLPPRILVPPTLRSFP